MADNMNHSTDLVKFEIMNVSMQPHMGNKEYNCFDKEVNNYSQVFKEHGWT